MTEPLIRFLGPTTVGSSAAPITLTGTLSERALWHLYLHSPAPIETALLAEAMWADETPKTWSSAFRTHIARLRRFLESNPEGPQLLHSSAGYYLTIPPGTVDVDMYRDIIQQSKAAANPTLQYSLLQDAEKLFLGEPFHGAARNELRETADRLLGIREEATRQRRLLAIELGRAQEVVDEFTLAGKTDYLDSMIVEPLAAAHISIGTNQSAREILSAHRTALESVGLEPGSGIAALERRLVRTVLDREYAVRSLATLPQSLRNEFLHVGRTQQLEFCDAAIKSEETSFILVQGPAGIGKTRLAQTVAATARANGAAVLATWVDENPAPNQPIDELVRSYTLAGSTPSSELVETLLSTLVEFAESRRLLVVFEDLHHADLATVKILRRIMRRDQIEGVTFLFTAREVADSPHVAQLLRELHGHIATQPVHLGNLSRDETFELVQQRHPRQSVAWSWTLAGRLHRETEGYPLLLDLLLTNRSDAEDGATESDPIRAVELDDAVALAAHRLSDSELDALVTASLVGIEADIGVIASVSKLSVAEVLDANDRGYKLGLTLRSGAPLVRFRHALVQHILPTLRSRVWRCERHLALADGLRTQGLADDSNIVFQVAFQLAHAVASDTNGAILDDVLSRVEDLQAQLRWEESLAVLDTLYPFVSAAIHSPGQRFHTNRLLALAADGCADSELSRTHFRVAYELAATELNPDWIFEIAKASGASSQPLDGDGERADWLRSALDPETALSTDQRIEVLAEYVYLRSMHEIDAETVRLASELSDLTIEVQSDRAAAFAAHGRLVTLLASSDADVRLSEATAAIAFGVTAPPEVATTPHLVRLVSLLELGRASEAAGGLAELEALTSTRERPADRWGLFVIRALLADWSGDSDSAERYSALGRELAVRHNVHGGELASSIFQFARIWRTGEWAKLDHYRTTPPVEPIDFIASSLYFAHTGKPDRVVDTLQFVVPALCEGAPFLGWLGACMVAGEAAAIAAPQYVDQLANVLLPYSGLHAINGLIPASTFGPVDRVIALLAKSQGRSDEAERFIERAQSQVQTSGLAGWNTNVETLRTRMLSRVIDLTQYDQAELTAS
jgi:hypothetical protein